MSNPNKGQWSWGVAFGRGTGGALGSGAAGVAMGSLGGPAGIVLGGVIGAAGGFVGGVLGYALGYQWDAPPKILELIGSAALYTSVVSGFLATLFDFLAWGQMSAHPEFLIRGMFVVSALPGFLASMSRSMIDDLRVTAAEKEITSREFLERAK
jgi:hypothetical protein